MHIHAIIHAAFEKPGMIEDWAREHNHQFSQTHTYLGERLPNIANIDFLVIMGGPQSPRELDQYPYLTDEISLTQQAFESGKAILGICLGAQIISESLGAQTEKSPNKEIGVFPIQLTAEGLHDPLFKLLPEQFDVMHWHNDMPGMAQGGVLLAQSEGCPRQAIRYGDRVYALQFHMEMTSELVQGMLRHCDGDLKVNGRYVQSQEQLLSVDHAPINAKMRLILDYLTK